MFNPFPQAVLFCHDKLSTHDLYVPDANFHRAAHDPVDIILSGSVDNFQTSGRDGASGHYNVVSSRDVPFNRKEGATIVYLERTNRPLVRDGREGGRDEREGGREEGREEGREGGRGVREKGREGGRGGREGGREGGVGGREGGGIRSYHVLTGID
jgi:hypothetical protein